jgi:hypothetical protein
MAAGNRMKNSFCFDDFTLREERSLRCSPTCIAAMFTAPARPANGMPRIKPRNKPRRQSLVSFSLYEDSSTRSRPQTRISRPFLRPLRRTEIRFVPQEMVDIFGTSRAWPMGINRASLAIKTVFKSWTRSQSLGGNPGSMNPATREIEGSRSRG